MLDFGSAMTTSGRGCSACLPPRNSRKSWEMTSMKDTALSDSNFRICDLYICSHTESLKEELLQVISWTAWQKVSESLFVHLCDFPRSSRYAH
jgi:hypothetical protein